MSVCNLADADPSLFEPTDFGMYCVVLMDADFGELRLRDSCLRYQPGTAFTMKPGHVMSMTLDPNVRPKGWMLAFRPDLIINTGLGRDFYMFNFFDYEVFEALKLYEGERRIMSNCFNTILTELRAPDDEFTGHMLRLGIGQLLSYCRRFYDRQFDTKKVRASELVRQLDSMLDSYLTDGSELPRRFGPPSVAWCSGQFHLSANYFGDVVKHELGITAKEYIRNKIMEKAKSLLADPLLSINVVASRLGFNYPNHFTRFFRNACGVSPSEFRQNL
ncbi:MAG: helix-turn-helix transcriptional regulator [Bacteroidaceae bacterium]|nr:helix-turn-helix transcriptional regulator [Bacteroidaceae bacterium]